MERSEADLGNWVPRWMIVFPLIAASACLGLGIIAWPFFFSGGLFLLLAAYFAAAHRLLAPGGGNVQSRVRGLLMNSLHWDGTGEALDIGCGNGAMALLLARRFPGARVTGIDFWGKNWDYSESACEENSRRADVDGRVRFQRASAAALPFADARFDCVVSNLVFHEVRDAADKRQCIREALRVLKPGGAFAFQDLFLEKRFYGPVDTLPVSVRNAGASEVALLRTCDELAVPSLLRLPFMLGRVAVLTGTKRTPA